ncbi:MAG: DUF1848 domain-containing protein [Veillonellaceae bacterium]|nr:DUF1848 domain-containing protein [Veillonellaceae bacterium]
MIISASRRTDIPAFYTDWFLRRIEEQYCTVAKPFNPRQVARVSLAPADVDAIVFWTKDARSLLPHLDRLTRLGYRYYFQYTVNGYGELFEPHVPPLDACIDTFCELAAKIGPDQVIWRYDPIVISNKTDAEYHKDRFAAILDRLRSATRRVVISFVDDYRKATSQFRQLAREGVAVRLTPAPAEVADLAEFIADSAAAQGIAAFSCAETLDLQPFGIQPGKCIDNALIQRLFGIRVASGKDRSQRPECGCAAAKDIGVYGTCRHGCRYCYAGSLKPGQPAPMIDS